MGIMSVREASVSSMLRQALAGKHDLRAEILELRQRLGPDVVADLNQRLGDRDRRIAELESALVVAQAHSLCEREACALLVDGMADKLEAERAAARADGDTRAALYAISAGPALRSAATAIRQPEAYAASVARECDHDWIVLQSPHAGAACRLCGRLREAGE